MKKEQSLPIISRIETNLCMNDYNIIAYYLHRKSHFTTFPPVDFSLEDNIKVVSVEFVASQIKASPEGGYCYSASVEIHLNHPGAAVAEDQRIVDFQAELYGYFSEHGQLLRSHYPHSFFILPPKIGKVGYRTVRMYFDNTMNIEIPQVCCCYENEFTSYYRSKAFSMNGHVFGKVVTSTGICRVIKNEVDEESPVVQWMHSNKQFIEENWARCTEGTFRIPTDEKVN